MNPVPIRTKLHPPKKTGERLLESEKPWEEATLNWFSVLQDQGKFRMWYDCYDREGWPTADDTSFCYAESEDGINWTRPNLGLFEYKGSKNNNILFRQIGTAQSRSRVHGSCVFIDPDAPPESGYKCVSQGLFQGIGDRPHYVAGMSSADGLHWTRREQTHLSGVRRQSVLGLMESTASPLKHEETHAFGCVQSPRVQSSSGEA